MKWYRRAAEQGDAQAQNNLGVVYSKGQSVLLDYIQAHKWYNLSAMHGDNVAFNNRNNIAKRMTPAQIAEAQRLARDWWAKHGKN